MSVTILSSTNDHVINYESLDSIDFLEKCGEIFFDRQLGCLIYLCSLCNEKFEDIEFYSKHLSDTHLSVESYITYEPNESDGEYQVNSEELLNTTSIEEELIKPEIFSEDNSINGDDANYPSDSPRTLLDIQVYVDDLLPESEIKQEETKMLEYVPPTTISENLIYTDGEAADPSDEEIIRSKLKCKFCGEQFDYVKELRQHDCGLKKTKKLHQCSVCNKVFKKKSGLDTHMMIHRGEKPHKCGLCKAAYACKQNLIIHIRRHTGEKPFKCDFCERTFASSTEKVSHMRTHTGERPFVCELCGKAHTSSSQLTEHMHRHLDIRNYACDLCDKRFRNSYNLRMHRVTHGDAPRKFICKHCPAAFKTQNNLWQHTKIHLKEKKYVCKICGRAFAQHPGLYSHMKSHAISK